LTDLQQGAEKVYFGFFSVLRVMTNGSMSVDTSKKTLSPLRKIEVAAEGQRFWIRLISLGNRIL